MIQEKDNSHFLAEKAFILKFSKKLEMSENTFLINFANFLKEKYSHNKNINYKHIEDIADDVDWDIIPNGNEQKKQYYNSCKDYDGDKQILLLSKAIEGLYLLSEEGYSLTQKGCAILGDTPFDKLNFIKIFLEAYDIDEKYYVIIDCQGKIKSYETLFNIALKNKDIPYVIFNNCENILKNEDGLRLFKHLCEDKHNDIQSFYILLGNANKIQEILEETLPENIQNVEYRINTFRCFIELYNI